MVIDYTSQNIHVIIVVSVSVFPMLTFIPTNSYIYVWILDGVAYQSYIENVISVIDFYNHWDGFNALSSIKHGIYVRTFTFIFTLVSEGFI